MPRGWPALLASLLLVALAFPPFRLVVPSLVALAPLAVWVAGRSRGGDAFRGGLWFGLALWLVLLRWLPVTLGRFLPEALPGWLLVVAVLGLVTAGVVWATWSLHWRAGLPLWLALPVAWTAGEWLRAHLPGSLAFPWLELAVSMAGTPELIGIAEVVGSRGVGFVLALVSGLLATAWIRVADAGEAGRPGKWRRGVPHAAAAVAVCVAVGGWGVHRAATLDVVPGPVVAVVQTAVPQEEKADRWHAAELGVRAVERLLPLVEEAGGPLPDVVLLPEAVLPVRLEGAPAAGLRARVEAAVRRAGVPVLLGALGESPDAPDAPDGPGREGSVVHNSVFVVRPGDGTDPRRYDKRHLVPVVERMPVPAWAGGGDGGRWGSYGAGRSAEPLVAGGVRAGVLICLESSFGRAARALRREGAEVLVNPTNDAWLNGQAAWMRTSALHQHPAHLVLRAIETRTAAARAANTGLSMFVDPVGHTYAVAGPFREGVGVRALSRTEGLTPWVRFGDVTGTASALAVVLLILAPVVTGRGRGGRKASPERHLGRGGG